MADEVATFGFDIDASGAQQGADAAASAVEGLQGAIDEGTAALSEMNKAMRLLKGGSSTDVQAFRELRDAIAAQKTSLSQLTAEQLKHGSARDVLRNKHRDALAQGKAEQVALKDREKAERLRLDAAKKAENERKKLDGEREKAQRQSTAALAQQQKAMADSINTLGGPLGGILGQFKSLQSLLGAGAMAGAAFMLVAAFAALTAGLVIATAAFVKFGIAAANARRDESLNLEGLTKARNWYGIAAGKATDLQGAIDKVSGSVHLNRGEIAGMTEGLYKANLRGEALKQGLEAVALATAAGGAAQGAFYQNMVVSAARSGVQVQRILDDARARYGELAARKMLSFDVQIAKARENLDGLFRNVKIEGFLKALNMVTSLFSQSTAEGRALQQLVTIVLNPLIGGLEKGGPMARRFFQGMILGAQDLIITVLTLAVLFKKTFRGIGIPDADAMTMALKLGEFAFHAFAIAALAAGGAVALAMAIAMAPLIILGAVLFGIGYAFAALVDAAIEAVKKLLAMGWEGVGKTVVDGIANGILGGIPMVIASVVKLGLSAKDALKKVWDSHSPSRAFEREGITTGSGSALGIRKSIPQVEQAADELGNAATISFAKAGSDSPPPAFPRQGGEGKPPPAAGASSAPSLVIQNLTVHADTEEGGRAAAKGFMAELTDAWRGVAVTLGAPTPGVT